MDGLYLAAKRKGEPGKRRKIFCSFGLVVWPGMLQVDVSVVRSKGVEMTKSKGSK